MKGKLPKLPKLPRPWLVCLGLALAAFVLKFCLPGYGFTAMVLVGIIAIISFYTITKALLHRWPKAIKWLRRCATICLSIVLALALVTETCIIAASFGDPDTPCQYMVVLGAKVRNSGPSRSLWDRIHGAYNYMVEHPEVIAIVSGGQGSDEPMTEAQAMYDELVKLGIDPSRIWLEEQARSTWGNLNLSLELIQERTGSRPDTLGVVSSEYHLFRAGLQARDCGVNFVGIPARTSYISQAINHFMREIAGVWHYIVLGGQYD